MILLIDNYDSFTYNLYQMLGACGENLQVVRNDEKTVRQIRNMAPDYLVLSPGPGRPENAGVCIEAIQYFTGKIPVLGVCLGHQAICQAFGGKIVHGKKLMHGKASAVVQCTASRLFKGMSGEFSAARYHSLVADIHEFPEELRITAKSREGEIMAAEHAAYPVFGIQFHPESILTPDGERILKNFLECGRQS